MTGGCPSIDGPEREGECIAVFEQCYDLDNLVESTKGCSISNITHTDVVTAP